MSKWIEELLNNKLPRINEEIVLTLSKMPLNREIWAPSHTRLPN